MNPLDEPTRLGRYTLRNRLVMAPMTRSRADDASGVPSPLAAQYYAQRAEAGLIITEGTFPSPMGKGYVRTPGIHSSAQIEGWKRVTEAVHAKGGLIFLQLMHCGRISHPSLLPAHASPVAPSAIAANGKVFTAARSSRHIGAPHAMPSMQALTGSNCTPLPATWRNSFCLPGPISERTATAARS